MKFSKTSLNLLVEIKSRKILSQINGRAQIIKHFSLMTELQMKRRHSFKTTN